MLKDVLRGAGWSVLTTFLLVILFAVIVKAASLGGEVIAPVVVGIKIVSVLFGCLKGIKLPESGWLKGLLVGAFYWAVTFAIFALLNGAGSFSVIDIAASLLAGLISAVIKVNIIR